jgi:hypothetical protein
MNKKIKIKRRQRTRREIDKGGRDRRKKKHYGI